MNTSPTNTGDTQCSKCGRWGSLSLWYWINGERVCPDCYHDIVTPEAMKYPHRTTALVPQPPVSFLTPEQRAEIEEPLRKRISDLGNQLLDRDRQIVEARAEAGAMRERCEAAEVTIKQLAAAGIEQFDIAGRKADALEAERDRLKALIEADPHSQISVYNRAIERANDAEATVKRLKTRCERYEKHILSHPHEIDHACRECIPGGDVVIDGFRCAYHEAAAQRAIGEQT